MQIKLDFNECLKDSPLFRKNIQSAQNDLESFENVHKKVNIKYELWMVMIWLIVFMIQKISDNCISFYNDGIKYLESYG
jgi:hypothetical protein